MGFDAEEFRRIKRRFSERVWTRGRRYHHCGAVHSVDSMSEGSGWSALVFGSDPEPYRVVLRWVGAHDWASRCSCPAPSPCKHVAALLMHLDQEVADPRSPSGLDSDSSHSLEVRNALREMGSWLKGVQAAPAAPSGAVPKPAPDSAVLYGLAIEVDLRSKRPWIGVRSYVSRRRKDGGWGKPKTVDLEGAVAGYSSSRAVTVEDELLWIRLCRLGPASRRYSASPTLATNEPGTQLFVELVETGRAFVGTPGAGMLQLGPERSGTVSWACLEDGSQTLQVRLESEDDGQPGPVVTSLPLGSPYYLDPASGVVGPLDVPLPDAVVTALATSPVLQPEAVSSLDDTFLDQLERAGLPLPHVQQWEQVRGVSPRPRLRLELDGAGESLGALRATASFDYGDATLPADASHEKTTQRCESAGVVYEVERDQEAERAALEHLFALAPAVTVRPQRRGPYERKLDGLRPGVDLFGQILPALRETSWLVEYGPLLQARLVEPDGWYVDAQPEGDDWFSLALGIEVDGQQVNILPAVVQALRDPKGSSAPRWGPGSLKVVLEDGRWVVLPALRLNGVLDVLVELHDDKGTLDGDRLRLPAADVGRTLELEDFTWRGADRLRKMAERLRRRTPLPPISVPKTLRAELRPYQRDGLAWLGFLRGHGFGGVLADDMGLGKTVQALAHILVEKRARRLDRPALVVAPRSALHNWRAEAERFAPSLRVAVYHGPGRAAVLDEKPQLVITTFALLQRDAELTARPWHLVILDEAQVIKNPTTAVAMAARRLDARQRLGLTGTPMENHLGDLWSLFAFVSPGLLGSKKTFDAVYRRPIEGGNDARLAALSARVAPFMLRRTKAEVLADLPPKTEQVLSIPMERAQRDLYESVRLAMEKRVRDALVDRGLARSQVVVLDALLKLRQACCHPQLVKVEAAKKKTAQSAKTDRLLDMLSELTEQGRRTLVFSQFTSMLDLLRPLLDARGIRHLSITGRTRKRQEVVEAFQADACDVLLISLKAGGTALNLTAADTVIHYDPWWNPAVEAQATDRAHRMGQTRPVTVVKMVCEGSVEERVLQLQARKASLTRALQEGAERRSQGGLALDADDVELMLAPLE